MSKTTLLSAFLVLICFSGCGGGSGGGGTGVPAPAVKVVAEIPPGTDRFTVDHGTAFFSSYDDGLILTASADKTGFDSIYNNPFSSVGRMVSGNGKVFILNTRTGGGIVSIAQNARAVTKLAGNFPTSSWPADLFCDGSYVYWSSGPKVLRTRLVASSNNTVETVYSVNSGNHVRMVADGGSLYISEAEERRLLRIDRTTLNKEVLLTFSGSAYDGSVGLEIPLTVDTNYIYAVLDNRTVRRIKKSTLEETVIPASYLSYYGIGTVSDSTGTYWWDQAPGNQMALKKCDASSGVITTLVTIPFTWNLDASFSDGINFYWFEHDLSPDFAYRIKSIPVGGGEVQLVANYSSDININGALLPSKVTFDTDTIYWSSQTTNLIAKMKKTGGSPEILSRFDSYHALTVNGGFVLAANNASLVKIPSAGIAPAVTEWSQSDTSVAIPEEMVKDETNLYWMVSNMGLGTDLRGQYDIFTKPIDGSPVTKLTTIGGELKKLLPYDAYLFIVQNKNGSGTVSFLPKTGGTERLLLTTQGVSLDDVQVSDDYLFFLAAGTIQRLDPRTGQFTTMVASGGPGSIYSDSRYLYWTDNTGLYRISLTGGSPQTIYSGPSSGLTGDDATIYWTAGRQILSIQKEVGKATSTRLAPLGAGLQKPASFTSTR